MTRPPEWSAGPDGTAHAVVRGRTPRTACGLFAHTGLFAHPEARRCPDCLLIHPQKERRTARRPRQTAQ